MNLNGKYILKEIASNWILVPFGTGAVDFNGVVTLNDTAKFLYDKCNNIDFNIDFLKNALIEEYKIDDLTALKSAGIFIDKLREAGCINE